MHFASARLLGAGQVLAAFALHLDGHSEMQEWMQGVPDLAFPNKDRTRTMEMTAAAPKAITVWSF